MLILLPLTPCVLLKNEISGGFDPVKGKVWQFLSYSIKIQLPPYITIYLLLFAVQSIGIRAEINSNVVRASSF